MATLPDLYRMRDGLLQALASGARTVTDANGESVTYRSANEINAALSRIDSEIAALRGGRSSLAYPLTSKGL